MLFVIIFYIVMLIFIIKALIETAYGAILLIWAFCLFVVGTSLIFLGHIIRIFEFLQEQTQKVCHA